jgi:single-strand DNA-binding protein
MSVNKVFLNGRLGNDAEIRTTQSGRVASITVATDEGWKDRESGVWNERTEWHRVISFQSGLVDLLEKHGKKGHLVNVVGKLASRKYRRDGEDVDRSVTEIVVDLRGEIDFPTPAPAQGAES